MKKFEEIFGKYIDKNKISKDILDSEIERVTINQSLRTCVIFLRPSVLLKKTRLRETENSLRLSPLAFTKVDIETTYPSSLFNENYFFELVDELKTKMPRINGTFRSSEVVLDDDTLIISLKNGGKALLDSIEFDAALSRLIFKEFSLNINVRYNGVTEINSDNQQYIEAQINTEKQLHRENLEKIAEMFEEEETNAKESAKSRAESVTEEIEIREGKFLTPQIITRSIRPLYGRMIKSKLMPVGKIEYDTGKATVWGDVFDLEKKVTKSGDKNIFNFDITDYTGSVTVKVFGPIKATAVCDEIKKGSTIVVSGDVEYDRFAGGLVLNARSIGTASKVKIVDNAPKKRVELHLHTNMSQMDAITPAGKLIERAASWGQDRTRRHADQRHPVQHHERRRRDDHRRPD
ncbi:MAG: PolC-type DNA polymerase III, partial [Ruminococcus sp.]|nr:PolC-type DNA polymerase III [Ruminococcus sp.]